jgi:hypothetical protein
MRNLGLTALLGSTLNGLWVASVLMAASACASIQNSSVATPVTHQGKLLYGQAAASGLVISGEELTDYSSRYFGLLELTFENKSANWLRVRRMDVDFGSPAKNRAVSLPWGADIDSWYSATVQRNDIRDTNRVTALAALLAIGESALIVGTAAKQRSVAATGGLLTLGSGTALVIEGQDARVQRAERVPHFPSSHLLSLPFAVPPGLFAKKWILLNTPERTAPCIDSVLLDYDLEQGGRERALLAFRAAPTSSEWQSERCEREAQNRPYRGPM